MAFQRKSDQEQPFMMLLAQINRQQQTVETLKAAGHSCPDAERQLHHLQETLDRLREGQLLSTGL